MPNFPSVTAAGAFESTAVQNAIKTLAEQAANSRLAVLEYRSGVRNASGALLNGWTGTASLCRVGAGCSLYFENLSSAAATSSIFFSLPPGFRPVKRPGTRVYRSMVTAGGLPPVLRQADIDEYGNIRIFTTVGVAETFSGSLEYFTVDPAPTTLPGVPA